MKNLSNLLDELLKEDTQEKQPGSIKDFSISETPLNVSLDQAVDRYIIRYEKESIPTIGTYEKQISDFSSNKVESLLEKLLSEAPEDNNPADAAQTNNLEQDLTNQEPNNSEEQQPIISTPQINLQDFTRSVARLVNNFEALINPKEIIINRVKEYIKNNYDVRTAQEFSELLEKNYNLSTLENITDQEDNWPTPYTAGALSSEG